MRKGAPNKIFRVGCFQKKRKENWMFLCLYFPLVSSGNIKSATTEKSKIVIGLFQNSNSDWFEENNDNILKLMPKLTTSHQAISINHPVYRAKLIFACHCTHANVISVLYKMSTGSSTKKDSFLDV